MPSQRRLCGRANAGNGGIGHDSECWAAPLQSLNASQLRHDPLGGEGECLDLHGGRFPQQPIDVDAEGMRRQFTCQPRTQAPEGMRMVRADAKLILQLIVPQIKRVASHVHIQR